MPFAVDAEGPHALRDLEHQLEILALLARGQRNQLVVHAVVIEEGAHAVAVEIEDAIRRHVACVSEGAYAKKVRSLEANLGRSGSAGLRRRVLARELSAKDLVTSLHEELAPAALQAQRSLYRQASKERSTLPSTEQTGYVQVYGSLIPATQLHDGPSPSQQSPHGSGSANASSPNVPSAAARAVSSSTVDIAHTPA